MNKKKIKPSILFASLYVFTFQPGNFTGLWEVKELNEPKEGMKRPRVVDSLASVPLGPHALIPNFGLVSKHASPLFSSPRRASLSD